jgi:YD repeat-containing protein
MLSVTIDPTGENQWCTFYRYNSEGLLIWTAQPSAVNGYDDSYDDLMNFDVGTGLYQYLNDSTGLINVTNYYPSTDIGTGAVEGYVENENVQQGQSGSDILLRSYTYTSNTDSGGNVVYPVATDVSYPDASDPSITITTSYSYTFYSGTNQVQQKTTTFPVISSGQNGSGTAATTVEEYDEYGNLTQQTDELGIVNTYTYAYPVLGVASEQTLNYQSGVTQPGVNVVTDFTYDDQGRLIQSLGPTHTVDLGGSATSIRKASWNVYNQSSQPMSGTWGADQNWTGYGYATGTGPSYTYTLIDPVSITSLNKDGRTVAQIVSIRTTGSGALSATDTFAQTDWQSWSSTQYDEQGHMVSQYTYFLIPSSGTGTSGVNYAETDYGYDALERQNRVVSPVGTITRTVWTTPQWVASVWMGTNDTGATDSNPAGSGSPNNMVMVTQNQYDGGSAGGDGNLTQVTQYASATDTRVTSYGYDFRDRKINMTGEINAYEAYTYDNLDRLTQTDQYNTSSSGNLINRSQTLYDDRNRVYQQIRYAVDPSSGTVGNALTGNTWYDAHGNTIQQIQQGDGQVFSKSQYNGVGWVTATYRGYNTTGTSYSQASTVSGDTILSQSIPTYDEAGNIVSQASFDRLNDATGTGALSAGTQPEARISYTASWFDGIDRSIASANYGAIGSFTRPSTPPSSSSTVLVFSTAYDNAGRVYETTDPNGIITQNTYDNAGRRTQIVEDQGGLDRTTNTTYTLDSQIAALTAVNADTGDQTTTYLYGTTLSDSGVARNDLLRYVHYPDSLTLTWPSLTVDQWAELSVDDWADLQVNPITDVVAYTYNILGQQVTITDQRGTVRTLYYDKLGRLTNDCVSTVGSDTDDTVLQIATAYEVRGVVQTLTSYDNATPGSGTVLNQVQLTYNTFSQLVEEQQEHGGAVSGSSPNVQYAYDSGASGSNEIRLNQLTYPNGRTIGYSYGTSGGMNDYLNRIDTIQDTTSGTTDLASYMYLGLGTVIRINYPQPSVMLDLWGGTSGAFNGFDLFNRIIDQRWET